VPGNATAAEGVGTVVVAVATAVKPNLGLEDNLHLLLGKVVAADEPVDRGADELGRVEPVELEARDLKRCCINDAVYVNLVFVPFESGF
jgi:hypothetical protein